MWDNIKWSNIPGKRGLEQAREVFRKTMAQEFPKTMKYSKPANQRNSGNPQKEWTLREKRKKTTRKQPFTHIHTRGAHFSTNHIQTAENQ